MKEILALTLILAAYTGLIYIGFQIHVLIGWAVIAVIALIIGSRIVQDL